MLVIRIHLRHPAAMYAFSKVIVLYRDLIDSRPVRGCFGLIYWVFIYTIWILLNNASCNTLSPIRRQAIAWTYGDIWFRKKV